MKRVALVLVLLFAACGSNADGGRHMRRVLVDYSPDDFPASFFGYFPRFVEAHPGDTIDFRQTWTGEPHTITLGTLTKPVGERVKPLFVHHRALFEDIPTDGLPSIFSQTDESSTHINQTAARPCYVASGPLPIEAAGCDKTQPAFDGTQEFYNSGYINYQGKKRNEFRVPLASSIKPGEYFYYCLLHGPAMGGFIEVKEKGASLTSPKGLHDSDLQRELAYARKARAQAQTKQFRLPGSDIQAGNFTLALKNASNYPASVNEFLPATFHAKVGQPVTWSLKDGPAHTVSFDVPSYIPAIEFRKDGSVELNTATYDPQGGPGYPRDAEPLERGLLVDAGRYDGSHFLSSGYPDGPMLYRVTFTKPGTYPYACLIHPLMLGKIVVSA